MLLPGPEDGFEIVKVP
jgi:splicing factor 3B subunit 1